MYMVVCHVMLLLKSVAQHRLVIFCACACDCVVELQARGGHRPQLPENRILVLIMPLLLLLRPALRGGKRRTVLAIPGRVGVQVEVEVHAAVTARVVGHSGRAAVGAGRAVDLLDARVAEAGQRLLPPRVSSYSSSWAWAWAWASSYSSSWASSYSSSWAWASSWAWVSWRGRRHVQLLHHSATRSHRYQYCRESE